MKLGVRQLCRPVLVIGVLLLVAPRPGLAATDWETDGLKGRVKSCRVAMGAAGPVGELVGALKWRNGKEYSPYGYWVRTYVLDHISGSIDESTVTTREYEFEAGNPTGFTEYQAGEGVGIQRHFYDANGRLERSEGSDIGVVDPARVIMKYDARGNLTEVTVNRPDSETRVSLAYDQEGRPVNKTFYLDGKINSVDQTEYAPGKKTLVQKAASGDILVYECTVDQYGEVTEKSTYLNGKLVGQTRFRYEVDSSGNWTKRVSLGWLSLPDSQRRTIQYIEAREITYYQ